jgi:non-structural maintenance of chromosomes element 1
MSADGETEDYNNANRAFLQAIIARGTLSFDDGQQILAAILSAHGRIGSQIRTADAYTE